MLILGNDPLSRFLNEAKGREWSWGAWDCGQWLGRYLEVLHGVNPAEQWQGTYRTAEGAYRLVQSAGGMVAHVERSLAVCRTASNPFPRTTSPARGDIVVVDAPEGETGAILLRSKVVRLMAGSGLVISELPILAAWKV